MQYLRANLSKKLGRLVDWRGGFWERRYSAEPVLDDAALVGRLRYVLAHGVKEGLVEKCAEWPGLMPTSIAGAGTAAVPVVQLDEALEQEGARGHDRRAGALR
ncbi:hypothetical protein [Archangium lansingense]|uniref:Transposase n=1 Tax=Archangium lansingense TaxID=2995310 RepID=A0ABT4AAS3_9BACT|nr:hypothetical protein [Archangium lansinium]MCY1078766.1 hypothetical protein [Archangium lansinium]